MREEKVIVRVFDKEKDRHGAVAVEEMCEVGPSGKMSLFTHLCDPVSRVCHSPAFHMLVRFPLFSLFTKKLLLFLLFSNYFPIFITF